MICRTSATAVRRSVSRSAAAWHLHAWSCSAKEIGFLKGEMFAAQIAGMKLEGDKAPPVQRHSAPAPATGKPEEPIAKHVTAALRQSAPAKKVRPSLKQGQLLHCGHNFQFKYAFHVSYSCNHSCALLFGLDVQQLNSMRSVS